jgi:DNA-binding transcriptional ArsR family regulator
VLASPSDDGGRLGRQAAIELAMEKLGAKERLRILVMAAEGPISAKEASNKLNKSIGGISYHVRALADDKLIRRRGAARQARARRCRRVTTP